MTKMSQRRKKNRFLSLQALSEAQVKQFREQPTLFPNRKIQTVPVCQRKAHATRIDMQLATPMVIVSLRVGVRACAVVSTMSITWGGKTAPHTVGRQCKDMAGSIRLEYMDKNVTHGQRTSEKTLKVTETFSQL